MPLKRIKVGHQEQANLPIYLHSNGSIICGNFKYNGSKKNEFKTVFLCIKETVDDEITDNDLDVSKFKLWDAERIYDEYISPTWRKSISSRVCEKLAIETRVYKLLEPLRKEFKRATAARWSRMRKKLSFEDPNWPSQGWHIFTNPNISSCP